MTPIRDRRDEVVAALIRQMLRLPEEEEIPADLWSHYEAFRDLWRRQLNRPVEKEQLVLLVSGYVKKYGRDALRPGPAVDPKIKVVRKEPVGV